MFKQIINIALLAATIPLQCVTITFQQDTSKPQPEHVIDIGTVHDISTHKRHVLNTTNPSCTIHLNPDDFINLSVHTSNQGHCYMKSKKPDSSMHNSFSTTLIVTEKMNNRVFMLDEQSYDLIQK